MPGCCGMLMKLHRRHKELPLRVLWTGSGYRVFSTSSLPEDCDAQHLAYRSGVSKV